MLFGDSLIRIVYGQGGGDVYEAKMLPTSNVLFNIHELWTKCEVRMAKYRLQVE